MKEYIQRNDINYSPMRWDAHACPPFKIGADLSFLQRYKESGINYVSLNVGFDLSTNHEVIELIKYFQLWVANHKDEYAIVKNVQQLTKYRRENILYLGFDIEGCNLLEKDLNMVSHFYSLGVRQMSFVYNNNNAYGGGCLDNDEGLTSYGEELLKKCNDVGILIDCSHVGYKTSLDIINLSKYPVIFSHSNPSGIIDHPRNIKDVQIKACAEKGGVIGINGIGIFLGHNNIDSERIVEHIDYVAKKVGVEHVGIGLDCVFNPDELKEIVDNNPQTFPSNYGFKDINIAQPEQFPMIGELLKLRGYREHEVDKILGLNFLRVAEDAWDK